MRRRGRRGDVADRVDVYFVGADEPYRSDGRALTKADLDKFAAIARLADGSRFNAAEQNAAQWDALEALVARYVGRVGDPGVSLGPRPTG
jgi:hypothetical protein